MAHTEIELLQQQIEKLKAKDFDLDAWKTYTKIILARIFGESTMKIAQIDAIKRDFGSWTLRDTSGLGSLDSCKKIGQKVLEAAIAELENFGLPQTSEINQDFSNDIIVKALEENLTVSQFRAINAILQSENSNEEKITKVAEVLNGLDNLKIAEIIAKYFVINKIRL